MIRILTLTTLLAAAAIVGCGASGPTYLEAAKMADIEKEKLSELRTQRAEIERSMESDVTLRNAMFRNDNLVSADMSEEMLATGERMQNELNDKIQAFEKTISEIDGQIQSQESRLDNAIKLRDSLTPR